MRRTMSCTCPARDHRNCEEGKLHFCAIGEDDDVRPIIDYINTCPESHRAPSDICLLTASSLFIRLQESSSLKQLNFRHR